MSLVLNEARFWAKVNTNGTNAHPYCWEWTASCNRAGYGQYRGTRAGVPTMRLAHRLAYELLVEKVPEGLSLDHLCRNRACVNPTHLEPVTQQENLLRGEGIPARNARKTHCPAGHEFYTDPRGSRQCRTCRKLSKRAWKEERHA